MKQNFEVRLFNTLTSSYDTVTDIDVDMDEYNKVYTSLKRVVVGRGIKSAFTDLFLNNECKKSTLTDTAGKTAGTIIRKHYDGDNVSSLIEHFDRPYVFDSNKDYMIGSLVGSTSAVMPMDFFYDMYAMTTVGPTSNATGRGELLTWSLFNDIDFNDQAGDLLKENTLSIEVKGNAAMIGTNAVEKGFRSATNAQHDLVAIGYKYSIDEVLINNLSITASLGVKSAPHYYNFIKAVCDLDNDIAMNEVATALLNNKRVDKHTKCFAESLKLSKNVNDIIYSILAVHFKVYQDYYKFDQFLIFKELNKKPVGFTILDPSLSNSVEDFAKLIQTTNVKVGAWGGSRPGGISIK